jgi:hypothetical protein
MGLRSLLVGTDPVLWELVMSTINEWNLVKLQFDALVHDDSVETDSIEKTFDEQVRRRFAEMINRAVEERTVWPSIARVER